MGCVSEYKDVDEGSSGYSYFPLNIGNYWIYEVVEIRYSIQNRTDTSLYYVKEWIGDSSIDQAGGTIHYLYTYKREDPQVGWDEEPVKVQAVKRSRTNLVVQEDNIPVVKLIFPVKTGVTWDGNANNTAEPQFYQYVENKPPVEINFAGAGKQIRVIINDFDDEIIFRDVQYEVYAENTGLLYKETSTIVYCQETSCLGQKEIKAGREIFQSLIEYGKE
jgi:hypothetical protein